MSEKAPDRYTPEYCSTVYERMKMALDSAVEALSLTNQNQKDLTIQTVKFLEESFEDVEKDIEELKNIIESQNKKIEEQNSKIFKIHLKLYSAGLSALVFLIGLVVSIMQISNKVIMP